MLDIPQAKTGFLGERVLAQNKIPKDMLLKHFNSIYEGFLFSIVAGDEEFLKEYAESTFSEKSLGMIQEYTQQKGYRFETYEDVHGINGEPVRRDTNFLDMVMIRGLNVDRSQNGTIDQYHKYIDIDDMGVAIYTPLHITDPRSFVDPI